MSTSSAERLLAWLLRLAGGVMLVALGAVIMPFEWMNAIHRHLELGELPDAPIVGYLTRSVSALYALHGALLLFLSFDVRRYLPVVRFLAAAGILFGVILVILDCAVGMPLPWTVGEGPFVVLTSGVMLWFIRSINSNAQGLPATAPSSEKAGVPPEK